MQREVETLSFLVLRDAKPNRAVNDNREDVGDDEGVDQRDQNRCDLTQELLTVAVNDPMGEEVYQCCECTGTFEVDWGEGVVRYQTEE